MSPLAELLRFYHLSMDEAARLTPEDRQLLLWDMERIRARESLTFIMNVGAVLAGDEGKRYMESLAGIAFGDDDWSYAQFLAALFSGA